MASSRYSRRAAPPFVPLTLQAGAKAGAKHRQLYDQIRGHVLSGRLAGGVRLPATRSLARDLGCSRNTVISAYELLLAEGYLAGSRGSGTFVSHFLAERFMALAAGVEAPGPKSHGGGNATLSARGRALAKIGLRPRGPVGAFMLGPDVSQFPFDV